MMSATSFRFIHASDFHIEQPISGLSYVPDHLRDLLIDAPLVATERVFDTALEQEVDFVILAGDALHARAAGPRGIEFIRRQFQRLQKRDIQVYWLGGRVDPPGQWPNFLPLPPCIQRLDHQGGVAEHRRAGQAIATILGHQGDGSPPTVHADVDDGPSDVYRIAVAYGQVDRKMLRSGHVNYWALGGRHSLKKLSGAPSTAQYCGSPQGKQPSEQGPHGCVLVHVDENGQTRCQLVPTDVVRWHEENITLTEGITQKNLEDVLRDRSHHLRETAAGRQLLVSWSISEAESMTHDRRNPLSARLRQGAWVDEMTMRLRQEFGEETPGVWTVQIQAIPPERLPSSWYEEDTILGDLLRLVRHYQDNEGEPLAGLDEFISENQFSTELAEAVRISDPRERQIVLRQVASLGADLLRGEGTRSD